MGPSAKRHSNGVLLEGQYLRFAFRYLSGIRFYLCEKRTKRSFRGMRCQLVLELWPPPLYWSFGCSRKVLLQTICVEAQTLSFSPPLSLSLSLYLSLSLSLSANNLCKQVSGNFIISGILSGLIWILKLFDAMHGGMCWLYSNSFFFA